MFEKNKRLFTAINEITHDKDCSTTCTVLLYVRGMIDVSILIDDLKAEAPPVLPVLPAWPAGSRRFHVRIQLVSGFSATG